jgi:hypothetical protein
MPPAGGTRKCKTSRDVLGSEAKGLVHTKPEILRCAQNDMSDCGKALIHMGGVGARRMSELTAPYQP